MKFVKLYFWIFLIIVNVCFVLIVGNIAFHLSVAVLHPLAAVFIAPISAAGACSVFVILVVVCLDKLCNLLCDEFEP